MSVGEAHYQFWDYSVFELNKAKGFIVVNSITWQQQIDTLKEITEALITRDL